MIITAVHIQSRKEYQLECRSGGNNALKCPVCADDRKKKAAKPLSYDVSKGVGVCHHCEAKFVEKGDRERMEPIKREYTRPKWENHTQLSEKAVKWFNGRGISQSTLMDLKVTEGVEFMPQVSANMNCIKFNYFRDGELVNVKSRDGKKNFKLVSGAELIFYNLDSITGKDEAYIVEGEIDALSFHEMGVTNVVSVPNGASKSGGKLEYLDNCWMHFMAMKTIYIATDNDEPGRALRDELARRLGKERCKIIEFGPHKDGNECLMHDKLAFTDYLKQAKDYPIEGVFTLSELRQSILDLKKNGLPKGDGISIQAFNAHLSFVPGYVTLITGVPNHGKGEFLDQIIVDLAHLHDWSFGIYTPENHPIQVHAAKLASKVCCYSFDSLSITDIDNFIHDYGDSFYYIQPDIDITLSSILEHATILVRKYGINGLVIDPWNKIDHQYEGQERQYISRSLDQIDNWARLNEVHVFIVAHPYKMQKDKETKKVEVPTPYSVSGTADWFNKVANCITVYRNFYEDGGSDTDVHIQKVKFKHWGSQGIVNLKYDYDSGRYYVVGFQNRTSYLKNRQSEIAAEKPTIKPNQAFINYYEKDNDPINPTQDAPF